MKEPTWII